jgi:hypothetical protein
VWLAALGVGGYGVYQLYRASAAKLSRQLDLSELSAPAVHWVIAVSRFGLAARGVVFCLIGYFFGRAAAGRTTRRKQEEFGSRLECSPGWADGRSSWWRWDWWHMGFTSW